MTVVDSAHVPTRSPSDNSNAAASTAYVTAAIAAIPVTPSPIPSGTAMVFYQASAPSGWTSVAGPNDRALRVVSAGGSGGTGGGSNSFSTVFAQTVVGSHTLTTAEMPAHTHSLNGIFDNTGVENVATCGNFNFQLGGTSGSAGSGGSHNHTITMAITFSDVIICTKN
jgi:hypothetical protein